MMNKLFRRNYFEGWYFKHLCGSSFIAFIPGISVDESGSRSAFVQIMSNNASFYVPYDFSEFEMDRSKLFLRVGENVFSDKGIDININKDVVFCKGAVKYGKFLPLERDIMGPFKFLPLECKHGIISLYHKIDGEIMLNNDLLLFDNGKGYIEKDWGRSFPRRYFWLECNDFDQDASISVSVADIPFFGGEFTGCICAIYYLGKEYRLATYKVVRIISKSKRELILKQVEYLLKINISADISHALAAPKGGKMSRTTYEAPLCHASFRFTEGEERIFNLSSDKASFEYCY